MAEIEVFADVCCPFTHVGLRRIIDRRHDLGRDEPRLHVRAWPLELANGTPLDAALIGEEVDELRRQVAPDLFFGFDPSAFPHSSRPAFALSAVAYQRDMPTGEAVNLELRAALFEQGRDISDPDVLSAIASRHGLRSPDDGDRHRAVEDWHDGQARGVVGSPHFFLATEDFFCPTLKITRDNGQLRITTDEESIATFIDTALRP